MLLIYYAFFRISLNTMILQIKFQVQISSDIRCIEVGLSRIKPLLRLLFVGRLAPTVSVVERIVYR